MGKLFLIEHNLCFSIIKLNTKKNFRLIQVFLIQKININRNFTKCKNNIHLPMCTNIHDY